MSTRQRGLWVLFALSMMSSSALAGPPRAIGVLGDSYSDEYRYYPPHCSRARNWVEILAETRRLNFGAISDAGRPEPRNQGFAYNWARSGATTEDMIRTGQHTGLAAQVASGEVDVVVAFIGGNDFINAGLSNDPDGALKAALPRAKANLRLAVETILRASADVKVVLLTVPDIRHLPEFREPIREGSWTKERTSAYSAALKSYNAEIQAIASRDPRVAVVDLDRVDRVSHMIAPEKVIIGDRVVDRNRPDDDPAHFFLGDRRHMGTLGQGMVAKLIVDKLNIRWNAGIRPIREDELVSFASQVFETTRPAELAGEATATTAAEGGGR